MDARIKCLNELKKLQRKMKETNCRHLEQQYEIVYASFQNVLTMIDDQIFGTTRQSSKKKAKSS